MERQKGGDACLPQLAFVYRDRAEKERQFRAGRRRAYRRRRAKVSGISKAYPLSDDAVIIRLYREVLAYWRLNRPTLPRLCWSSDG